MGKGTKRKNAGVGVDFRRVKHKVGKKLPKAQNQTDTNFKSRAINLPDQSVLHDKEGAAVTNRNLTLKDLISQCGHYSDKVRREAVQGLAELLAAHPQELRRNPTLVMEALAVRVTDGDQGVRAALRATLASPVLPTLGPAALGPFVPLLMAHVCSAMTHLADQIRGDSLAILQLLSEWRPDLISSPPFLAPTLEHFGDLLSKGSRGRSLAAGSLAALYKTMAALEGLLRRLAAAGQGGGREGRGESPEALVAGEGRGEQGLSVPLFRFRCAWPPLLVTGAAAGIPGALGGGGSGLQGDGVAAAGVQEAAQKLLGRLLDCWSDCSPAQLAQAPELPLAQCMLSTLRCCDLLLARWGVQLAGSYPCSRDKPSLATSLLHRLSPLFPLNRPSTALAPSLEEALVQINATSAQLLARFLPSQLAASGAAENGGWEDGWPGRLLDWFEGVMRGEGGALPEAGGGLEGSEGGAWVESEGGGNIVHDGAGEAARRQGKEGKKIRGRGRGTAAASEQLPSEVYSAALGGVMGALQLVGAARRRRLLGATWALWERSSVRSAKRVQVLSLWRSLLASPATSLHTPLPPTGEPLVLPSEALSWLQAMPRFLWELGASSPATTEGALRLLLDGARFACRDPAALAPLQQQLCPLFATLVPQHSGKAGAQYAQHKQQQQRLFPGPLTKHAQRTQQLAVDVLLQLPSLPAPTLTLTTICCLSPTLLPAPVALRLLEGVAAKACAAWREASSWGKLHPPQQPGGLGEGCGGHAVPAASMDTQHTDWGGDDDDVDGEEEGEGGAAGAGRGGAGDAAAFGGMLLCLLSGASRAGVEGRGGGVEAWRRHEAVVRVACAGLPRGGAAGAMAAALSPALVDLCVSNRSPRPLFGALSLGLSLTARTARGDPALTPPLAAELPGVMLCYVTLCAAAQQGQAGGAGAACGLPPAREAVSLSMGLLGALPALLPALLDCISAALARAAQQGKGTLRGGHDADPAPPGPCSSQVVEAWMTGATHRAPVDVAPSNQVSATTGEGTIVPLASWAAGALLLLERLLEECRGDSSGSEALLREEGRAEAAVRACEVAAQRLEQGEMTEGGEVVGGVARVRTLFDILMGRRL